MLASMPGEGRVAVAGHGTCAAQRHSASRRFRRRDGRGLLAPGKNREHLIEDHYRQPNVVVGVAEAESRIGLNDRLVAVKDGTQTILALEEGVAQWGGIAARECAGVSEDLLHDRVILAVDLLPESIGGDVKASNDVNGAAL